MLGEYKQILDVARSFITRRGDKSFVKVVVEYKKGTTLAELSFLKVESAQKKRTWKLLHARILLPRPKLKAGDPSY